MIVNYIERHDWLCKKMFGVKRAYELCIRSGTPITEKHVYLTRSGRHITEYDCSTPNHPNDIRKADELTDGELATCREVLNAYLTLRRVGLAPTYMERESE